MMNVGDRVRYVAEYKINRTRKNAKQDLVPGYEGTIVALGGVFPYQVRFDKHAADLIWWVSGNEVDHISKEE